MGRVKSDMFEDQLGLDDELVPLPASQLMDNLRDCDHPRNSVERYDYIQNEIRKLLNELKTNTD
jgi:hypothetical protein